MTCIAFSPNGRYLASGSKDNTIRIWDLSNIEIQEENSMEHNEVPCSEIIQTNFPIFSLAWREVSNDLLLATGGGDSSVRLWKKEQEKTFLIWSSCQSTLHANNANLDGAILSQYNARLLKQKGSINDPININQGNIEPSYIESSNSTASNPRDEDTLSASSTGGSSYRLRHKLWSY